MNKPKGLFLALISKYFCIEFNVFLDKYTLDFPQTRLCGGMKYMVWLQDNNGKPSDYDCYGVSLEVAFWFLEIKLLFTPIVIKRKTLRE